MFTNTVRTAVFGMFAFTMLLATPISAKAGNGVVTTNCLGGLGSTSCVLQWQLSRTGRPGIHTLSAQDTSESAERERLWVNRCRPVVKQDRYGVSRYRYAAPGCEFGKFED